MGTRAVGAAPASKLSGVWEVGEAMVKAALCDIDGTLIQSNWLHAAAWKDVFA
jgi:hypothetical protein